ncbi:MAG: hypothetical protein AAF624_12005, partial [Bacteroidota bacterium]
LAATGYVVATDVVGNADSLLVDIAALPPDAIAPLLSGSLDAQTFAGSATERQADDRGLATVALSVDAVNLTLLVDAFEAGADSVGYSAMSVDPDLAATGYVVATDVVGNADSVLVDIGALPPDELAPLLSGTLDGGTYTGSATERRVDDRGLASLALSGTAANLSLTVDSFEAGADSVWFAATSVDALVDATGWVVATDVASNADSVYVEILAPQGPPFDLTIALAYAYNDETDGTITVTAINAGTETMNNVRVKRTSFSNVTIAEKQLLAGTIPGGGSSSVVFTFSGASPDAIAKFKVQDLEVRVRDEDDPDNNIAEIALVPNGGARIAGLTDGEADVETDDSSPQSDAQDQDVHEDPAFEAGEFLSDAPPDASADEASSGDSPRSLDDRAAEDRAELDRALDSTEALDTESQKPDEGDSHHGRSLEGRAQTDAPETDSSVTDSSESGKPETGRPETDAPAEGASESTSPTPSGKPELAADRTGATGDAQGVADAPSVEPELRVTSSEALPEALTMQLYPNPGQSRRTIELALPARTEVRMTLTDLLGRQVGAWTYDLEPGPHLLNLDIGAVAAGPYVLDVMAGTEQAVVRLTVLP